MRSIGERRDVAVTWKEGVASSALSTLGRLVLALAISVMLAFLFLPLISVFISRSPLELISNLNTEIAYQALLLSLETTLVSLSIIVVFGTPLAYWVAKYSFRGKRILEVALQMPIVVPPPWPASGSYWSSATSASSAGRSPHLVSVWLLRGSP